MGNQVGNRENQDEDAGKGGRNAGNQSGNVRNGGGNTGYQGNSL